MTRCFPFTAVVGQQELKTALLLALVDPAISGVLISGARGSAKSTLVRSLADLLPQRQLVNLPLGATDEMLTGSLQLDSALQRGAVEYAPGLLARADGGLLYVDEVNLLPDNLVDLLLDVAASGVNHIERDGISHRHSARFVLIGTMNPDEGELRPQLLDRFSLMATVQEQFSVAERQQIVHRRLAFDADPQPLLAQQAAELRQLKQTLELAIDNREEVVVPAALSEQIACRCIDAQVEGLRADIMLQRACRAHAALAGRAAATLADLDQVAELVLRHRRRPADAPPAPAPPPASAHGGADAGGGTAPFSAQGAQGAMPPQAVPIGRPLALPERAAPRRGTGVRRAPGLDKATSRAPGRHQGGDFQSSAGAADADQRLHWHRILSDADNRAQMQRDGRRSRLHFRYRSRRAAELDIVLLDTSASTLGRQGLSKAMGVIGQLSHRGYLARRRLAVITFGNDQVCLRLPPQRAPRHIEPLLRQIRAGGGTPLGRAMQFTHRLLTRLAPLALDCRLYIFTDGRVPDGCIRWPGHPARCRTSVIDTESVPVKLGLSRRLAQRLEAAYFHIAELEQPADRGPAPIRRAAQTT